MKPHKLLKDLADSSRHCSDVAGGGARHRLCAFAAWSVLALACLGGAVALMTVFYPSCDLVVRQFEHAAQHRIRAAAALGQVP
jgi:hypothetical protein